MNDKLKKPDLVEMAKQKRHINILKKIKNPDAVPTKSEVKELNEYEIGSQPEGIVETQEQVAQIFRVSTRTVQYWAKDGMPARRNGTYSIADIKSWRSIKTKNTAKKVKGSNWKQELEKQRALKAIRENQLEEGLLLQRSSVEQDLINLFSAIKTLLISFPRGLSPQLQGLDARQIEEILTGRINELLAMLSTEKIFISKDAKKNTRKNKKT